MIHKICANQRSSGISIYLNRMPAQIPAVSVWLLDSDSLVPESGPSHTNLRGQTDFSLKQFLFLLIVFSFRTGFPVLSCKELFHSESVPSLLRPEQLL